MGPQDNQGVYCGLEPVGPRLGEDYVYTISFGLLGTGMKCAEAPDARARARSFD